MGSWRKVKVNLAGKFLKLLVNYFYTEMEIGKKKGT